MISSRNSENPPNFGNPKGGKNKHSSPERRTVLINFSYKTSTSLFLKNEWVPPVLIGVNAKNCKRHLQ